MFAKKTLRLIARVWRHPLNRGTRLAAVGRAVRWQLGSRLVGSPVVVPFVGGTRLIAGTGVSGATGAVYYGLDEFEEMAFVLHSLRAGEVFVDVGANVGSYSVLAAGAVGARCIAVEPVPETFAQLVANVRLNGIEKLVEMQSIALGGRPGTVRFSARSGTMNHVVRDSKTGDGEIEVRIDTLDRLVGEAAVSMMKIDVEGFESPVLEGAARTMRSQSLAAVVIELKGHGARYGFDEAAIRQKMRAWGFAAIKYEPGARRIEGSSSFRVAKGRLEGRCRPPA